LPSAAHMACRRHPHARHRAVIGCALAQPSPGQTSQCQRAAFPERMLQVCTNPAMGREGKVRQQTLPLSCRFERRLDAKCDQAPGRCTKALPTNSSSSGDAG
jgi:hypothetical protein